MKLKSAVYAPVLFGVIMILAGFSGSLIALVNRVSEDGFLSVAIIQLLVFLLPVAFYCRVRNINYAFSLKFKYIQSKQIPFLLTMALIFFLGTVLLRYIGVFYLDGAMTDTPSAIFQPMQTDKKILVILCFIIIPALLEETVFRGIILEEYAKYGSFWSVSATALAFAMLHGSFENFVFYLFQGVIFGIMTVLSKSILPSLILHTVDNFFYFYGQTAITDYIRQTGKSPLFPFILIALLLLLIFVLFSQLETIYQNKAFDELLLSRKELLRAEAEGESRKAKEQKPNFFLNFREILLSPTFLVCVAIFVLLAANIF